MSRASSDANTPHDASIHQLERSVSLCTLCELEAKYLDFGTQRYGLSQPTIELSSAISDDSPKLDFTADNSAADDDYLATIADLRQLKNYPLDKDLPIFPLNEIKKAKVAKKSPILNDDDLSLSFVEFLKKTTNQIPKKLAESRWDRVSWDKSNDKSSNNDSAHETRSTSAGSPVDSDISEEVIHSFINDIDNFLNEGQDELVPKVIEGAGEDTTQTIAKEAPRVFDSDITDDEIPRKRSKISLEDGRLFGPANPQKFANDFMNVGKSGPGKGSKIFAANFPVSSVNVTREERMRNEFSMNCTDSSLDSSILRKELDESVEKIATARNSAVKRKSSNTLQNCTQSFLRENILAEKQKNIAGRIQFFLRDEKSFGKEETSVELPQVGFPPTLPFVNKSNESRDPEDDAGNSDIEISRKRSRIDDSPRLELSLELPRQIHLTKLEDDTENSGEGMVEQKPKVAELPVTGILSQPRKREDPQKSETAAEALGASQINGDKQEPPSTFVQLPMEVDTKTGGVPESADDSAMPSDEDMRDEVPLKKPKIVADEIIHSPLRMPFNIREQVDSMNADDAKETFHDDKPFSENVGASSEVLSSISTSSSIEIPLAAELRMVRGIDVSKNNAAETTPEEIDRLPEKSELINKSDLPEETTSEEINGKGEQSTDVGAPMLPVQNSGRIDQLPEKNEIEHTFDHPDESKLAEIRGQEKQATDVDAPDSEVSESLERINPKNQTDALKPGDKLEKTWKALETEFESSKNKRRRRPSYPPLAPRKSPPPPDLKILRARAVRKRELLANAVNRMRNLSSYMDEVIDIFRGDNIQHRIVKPANFAERSMKIFISTSTQTGDSAPNSPDPRPQLSSVTGVAGRTIDPTYDQENRPRNKSVTMIHGGPSSSKENWNNFNPPPENGNTDVDVVPKGSEANPPRTLRKLSKITGGTKQNDQQAIARDVQTNNPPYPEKNSDKLRNEEDPNESATPGGKVFGLNLADSRKESKLEYDIHTYNPLRPDRLPRKLRKTVPAKKPAGQQPRQSVFLDKFQ